MIFPESRRVIYEKNPLRQVICQVRFPAILRIVSEPPVDFQDRIRGEYPLFVEKREATINLPEELSKKLPSEFLTAETAYEFASADEQWSVTLTRGFLALTSRHYERWEDFCQHLAGPLTALMELHSPPFFSRTGLRYQDVIKRSALELGEVEWEALLNPKLAGELSDKQIAAAIKKSQHEFQIEHNSNGDVRIRHGLVRDDRSGEMCYLIDADFFTEERLECENARARLDEFNREAGRLFRWCISDRLHDAMGPRPVG
jgi:uncharacterized protein (TIGR04255 family)